MIAKKRFFYNHLELFSLGYNAEYLKYVEILVALFLSINLSP